MKEQERYFFEPRSLTGCKTKPGKISKFADTVFETKVLRNRHDVCLFLLDRYIFKAFIFFRSINTVW